MEAQNSDCQLMGAAHIFLRAHFLQSYFMGAALIMRPWVFFLLLRSPFSQQKKYGQEY